MCSVPSRVKTKSGASAASWAKFPALRINRTLNGGEGGGRAFRLTKSVNALLTFGELHGPGESWSANSAPLLPVSSLGKVSRATRKSPRVTWSYSDHVNRVTDKPTWTSLTTLRGVWSSDVGRPTTSFLSLWDLETIFKIKIRGELCGINFGEASNVWYYIMEYDRNSFRESNVTHLTNLALSRVDVMVRTGLKVVQRVGEGGARRKREITNPWTLRRTREREIYRTGKLINFQEA